MENQNQEKAARAIGRVAVIGCGRWGSLIAWYLSACRGLDVTLYGRPDSTHMQRFLRERRNDLLTLPDSVQLSTDLASALEGREVIVISIGAQGLRGLMEELRPLALRDRIVVLCMKGVEADTGLRLSEIAGAALDPSFNDEMQVTVIATNFESEESFPQQEKAQEEKPAEKDPASAILESLGISDEEEKQEIDEFEVIRKIFDR